MAPEALSIPPASYVLPPLDPPPRTGWDAFDDLRLPGPGKTLLFDVDPDAAPLAQGLLHGLAVGAVAARGHAWIVDASGAGVEAWRLMAAASALGVPARALAERVHVARLPHPGDLLALFERGLPTLAEDESGPRVLLVTGLPEACLDGAMLSTDALALLHECLLRLARLATDQRVAVVLSTSVLSRRATRPLRDLLLERADEAATLRPAAEGGLRVRIPRRGLELRVCPPEPLA